MANNIENLLRSYLLQVQELEDSFFELLQKSGIAGDLSQMEGAQLDAYGALVGQERKGLSDERYRLTILARILVNNSDGTIETIIEVILAYAEAIGGVAITPRIEEFFPAFFQVYVGYISSNLELARQVGEAVQESKPAGVGAYFHYHASTTPFTLGDSTGLVTPPPDTGFGSNITIPPFVTFFGPGGEWSAVIG